MPHPFHVCHAPKKFTEKNFRGTAQIRESFPLYSIHKNMYPLCLLVQPVYNVSIEQKRFAIMDKSPLPTNNNTMAEFGYVCTFFLA